MRAVSVEDFIRIVHSEDSNPPSPATIRRLCNQDLARERPCVPGAYKFGKAWKIDLDTYLSEMDRRIRAATANEDKTELAWVDGLAAELAS